MVIVVEVPVVWEVSPRGGFVVVAAGAACFVGFVGFGLVLQDLWNDSVVGFGGDENIGEDQRPRGPGRSLAFVLLDSS